MTTNRIMRAKMRVSNVSEHVGTDAEQKSVKYSETLTMHAVAKSDGPYPDDGSDENNSFARWSPNATLSITIANPHLWDRFNVGDQFYVDFTRADLPKGE
jgi:hypothetical protein